ncbi:MAG: hypothetical protein AC479_04490 [miscellaneous Crenarchaeota group-6 archaeon AD8-1]|nr:MAG: hypothetical protein AC479_04490 [miscellaneous Crenarchaeota group-6 archaeon AD8-1]
MNIESLVSKYINSAEKVFNKIQVKSGTIITNEKIDNVIKYAKDYLEDSKYYKNQGEFKTSLTSIAYCEGVLDALKLLDVVNFDWITKEPTEK